MRETIRWTDGEWHDGITAEFKGYVADLYWEADKTGKLRLVWTVKATDEVSEWPELQDIGHPRTFATGQRAAEQALRTAAAR